MAETGHSTTSLTPQPAPSEWRILAKHHAQGARLVPHQHSTAQLIFALSGIMSVETGPNRWTIPPQRALWVPPRQLHTIQMLSPTEMRTVYFQPSFVAADSGFARHAEVHAVAASPLVKALVLGLFDECRDHTMRSLMARLLLHALGEATCLPTHLPMPTSEELRRAAMQLLEAKRWQVSMHELACSTAMSERSFSRRFAAEVGLSFRVWRQRARLIASLDLLAGHHSIKFIAHAMQFRSSAAYTAAFSGLFGCPPQAFRNAATDPGFG